MEEKFGIENLKKVLDFGIKIGKEVASDLEDNKFSLSEGIALAAQFGAVSDLIAKKDDIINEAKDLSLDEIKELIKDVEGELTSEKVVAIIENALSVIVGAKNLIEIFTKKADTPPVE